MFSEQGNEKGGCENPQAITGVSPAKKKENASTSRRKQKCDAKYGDPKKDSAGERNRQCFGTKGMCNSPLPRKRSAERISYRRGE